MVHVAFQNLIRASHKFGLFQGHNKHSRRSFLFLQSSLCFSDNVLINPGWKMWKLKSTRFFRLNYQLMHLIADSPVVNRLGNGVAFVLSMVACWWSSWSTEIYWNWAEKASSDLFSWLWNEQCCGWCQQITLHYFGIISYTIGDSLNRYMPSHAILGTTDPSNSNLYNNLAP